MLLFNQDLTQLSFSPLIVSLVNDSTHPLNVTAELEAKQEELIERSVLMIPSYDLTRVLFLWGFATCLMHLFITL